MVPPCVLANAEYDSQKLPGNPPRADLNSVSMPSVLDWRAENRSSWRMVAHKKFTPDCCNS
ncbi:MAG: hypothetical protein U1E02_00565, partial [Hydrogenophaga sp.]|nr:hypothetical protein [Hydrogenophaga sp.]